VEALKLV